MCFKIEDAEHLSFKDKSFDAIFSINTIHHLVNPYKVVDELMRVISSRGKIIISDFNEEGHKIMEKIHESEGRKHASGIVDLEKIKDYFKSKDFTIDEYKSKFQDVLIAYRK